MNQQAMLSNGPFDRPGVSIQPGQIRGDSLCRQLGQLFDWRQKPRWTSKIGDWVLINHR
jgi:hypothetical protein